jgi:glycosyltransferase involved in cell wall biosynthesis
VRQIRILHVSHAVNTGLAQCVADYVDHQVGHGARVTVASPGGRLGALAAARGADTVRWVAARGPGVGMLREAAGLRRIVRRVAPDVVHLHCAKAGLLGRLAVRGRIPTVFSPHAWSFLAVDGAFRRLVLGWERTALRWTDVVACVSAAERDTGIANGLAGRLDVLPNRIDAAALEPVRSRPRAVTRAGLDVDPTVPLVVCSARLVRQKGQDVLLAAWPAVRAAIPGAELVLVGDGPARPALAAVVVEGARLVGAVERETSLRWLHAADVVACPSRWEGMSLVALEAMALGRPLVVTAVDGMAEAVPPGTGWIVPPEDTAALAAALVAALSDPVAARTVGEAGRQHALAASPGASAARLFDLYLELAAARGRSRLPA